MHQDRREESVSCAGRVNGLDLEGRDAAAELPGRVESPLGAKAYEDKGDAASQEVLRGFFCPLHAEQRRELVLAQLDDRGEIEQWIHGLAGGLGARPEVFAEVDVEGRRDVQVAREPRGLMNRRVSRVLY